MVVGNLMNVHDARPGPDGSAAGNSADEVRGGLEPPLTCNMSTEAKL